MSTTGCSCLGCSCLGSGTRKPFLYTMKIMKKPAFCLYDNKDADQLHGNRAADQCLYFCYIDIAHLLYFLNQIRNFTMWLYSPFSVRPGLSNAPV